MRIAALYDIHGNLPALEAVMEEVSAAGVDHIVVGGDVIPGPMPAECFDKLRGLKTPTSFILGNGEAEVLSLLAGEETGNVPEAFREVMRWVGEQLPEVLSTEIAKWPSTWNTHVPTLGDILFCHATPRNNTEIFTHQTSDERIAPAFADVTASVVVCGHTHIQFDRSLGDLRIVNAGSVGMPFSEPGAYWLLLDGDVKLRVTRYDLERAAERIRATSYPQAQQFAETNVLAPPREKQMLEVYARGELGG